MLHMEQNQSEKLSKKQIGALGEQITAKRYKDHGFKILGMNYLKKWGEIDVITSKDNVIHFIEVKTVSYETKSDLELAVAQGTWRPEENVTAHKVLKLSRAIESWLGENNWDGKWQIDVAAVRIVPRETFATIKIIDNIIIS
ncbi:MAG: YraN family protein [Candidatus Paceibacteria bacterium]